MTPTFRWLALDSRFEEVPFRRLFRPLKRPVPPNAGIVTAYTDGQVTLRSNRDKKSYHEAKDLSGFQGVASGDFVVHGLDILRGSVGVADSSGAMSSVCTVSKPLAQDTDPRFFAYAMRAQAWAGVPRALAKGVREGGADFRRWETLAELPLPVPHPMEQRAIADYLDTETARIDALITKKQQLDQALTSWRESLTLELVTGSNISEPRKASDLAWAEEVPSSWPSALLRLVATQGTGHTPSRSRPEWWNPEECVVPWITTGEVAQVRSDRRRVVSETRERISAVGIENSSAEVHPVGTVFLCRTASAGYSGIMGVDMATSQDFATWTCGDMLKPHFLLHCLRAMRGDLLGRLATGSTHKTIYMPDIQGLKIPLPPVDVQERIVAELEARLDRSFALSDALHLQIELLTERRRALVTAAVTGEFRVPGVV